MAEVWEKKCLLFYQTAIILNEFKQFWGIMITSKISFFYNSDSHIEFYFQKNVSQSTKLHLSVTLQSYWLVTQTQMI